MKTAEYWSGDIAIPPLGLELVTSAYRDYVINIIEQIQSDAIESTVKSLKVSLIRAFTMGHHHGHESTVEGTFIPVHQQDVTTYFDELITEAMTDGSFPELIPRKEKKV